MEREKSEEKIDCRDQESNQGPSLKVAVLEYAIRKYTQLKSGITSVSVNLFPQNFEHRFMIHATT